MVDIVDQYFTISFPYCGHLFPLCFRVQINLANLTSSTGHEDDEDGDRSSDHKQVSPGMMTWRNAVAKASNPAQLSLCVSQLHNSISWEKSIMKVVSHT